MEAISGLSGKTLLNNENIISEKNKNLGSAFFDVFMEALGKTNESQLEAEKIANEFAAGKTENIHQVLIAAEKADIALQFTMQIRNKIMDAYNELMRINL